MPTIKDILQDVVQYTHKLGFFDVVRMTSDDDNIKIDTVPDDKSVVLIAESKDPYELKGVFGLHQLNKLALLLTDPEYQKDAKIQYNTIDKDGTLQPTEIHFKNKDGNYENTYRLMAPVVLNQKLPAQIVPKGITWNVTLVPDSDSIKRFIRQCEIHIEHPNFTPKTDGSDLVFYFGDDSSHQGKFVFSNKITGSLSGRVTFPVDKIIGILKNCSNRDVELSFSEKGAIRITVDSGLSIYRYIIPAAR